MRSRRRCGATRLTCAALLGERVQEFAARRGTLTVDHFPTGAAFRDYFKANYGPTITAYRNIAEDSARVAALDAELADLGDRWLAGSRIHAVGVPARHSTKALSSSHLPLFHASWPGHLKRLSVTVGRTTLSTLRGRWETTRASTKGHAMANSSGLLFNPDTYDPGQFDPETRRQLRAVIDWFEARGKTKLLRDDLDAVWVSDFLDLIKRERIFATFLTPSEYGIGDPNKRWDTSRNAALSEIFGFYGLAYWYAEQVTILGLGPIWQSDNIKAKERAAEQLEAGGVMAFGLSEREHGADIYNTDMVLTPVERGRASLSAPRGRSTTSATATWQGWCRCSRAVPTSTAPDGYVWFVADSGHETTS